MCQAESQGGKEKEEEMKGNHKPNTKCIICETPIYIRPSRNNGYNCCSIACRNKWFSKERHPRWKGGPKHYKKSRVYARERRLRNKLKAIEYLGGECESCGYQKCHASLDFHHKDPLEKDSTIKDLLNHSWKKIQKELDKCMLLCSNCHRELHWEQDNG